MFEVLFALFAAPLPANLATPAEIESVKQAAYYVFEEEGQKLQAKLGRKIPAGRISSVDLKSETLALDYQVVELHEYNLWKKNGLRRFAVRGLLRIQSIDGNVHYLRKMYKVKADDGSVEYSRGGWVRALVEMNEQGKVVRAEANMWNNLMKGEEPYVGSSMRESFPEQFEEHRRQREAQLAP